LERTRVSLGSPIVFLCGGLVDIKEASSQSVRHALVSYLHSVECEITNNLTLAEEFKDWLHDSTYKDLLAFEGDIAHLSSMIVIVLESPGSLTELGLFVRNKFLNKKLVIFINEEHDNEDSFISLGPVRHLRSINPSSVFVYPWNRSDIDQSLKPSLPEMRQDLLGFLNNLNKSEAFDSNNEGHLSFLIYEIIRIYTPLKISEIDEFLRELKIILRKEKLKRLIFLLSKFDLIKSKRRGHDTYYLTLSEEERLKFGGHFDKAKAKISARQYYALSNEESKRSYILSEVSKTEKESL